MAYEIVPCKYSTFKDLQARLDNTICRYRNEPFFVRIRNEKEIALFDLSDYAFLHGFDHIKKSPHVIHPTDPDFDISFPEMGYLTYNYTEECRCRAGLKDVYPWPSAPPSVVLYVKKNPLKQYRQGVDGSGLSFSFLDGSNGGSKFGVPFSTLLYSQAFGDMIRGNYPPLPAAIQMLRKIEGSSKKEMAISKDVAIELTPSDIIQVYIKQVNIGYILPDERIIHVKQDKNAWISRKILETLSTRVD